MHFKHPNMPCFGHGQLANHHNIKALLMSMRNAATITRLTVLTQCGIWQLNKPAIHFW